MPAVNRVTILGNLGQDPEVRVTPNGQHVCTLRVATTETWMKDGQKQEKTEWHRVVVWGKTAENCGKYLKKGQSVYLEGKLETRSWDDAQTGQKRYATEIIAQDVQFLSRSSGQGGGSGQGAGNPQHPAGAADYDRDDDVPF